MSVSTKQAVYDAALVLFYQKGYHGTSMREICDQADVRMSSVYHYYANKQTLLFEILRTETRRSTAHLRKRLKDVTDPVARLDAAVLAHVEWHTSRQQAAFVCDAELRSLEPPFRDKVADMRHRHEAYFIDVLTAVVDGQRPEADVAVLMRTILAGATGVAAWFQPEGKFDAATIAALISEMILHGIRPTTSITKAPAKVARRPAVRS